MQTRRYSSRKGVWWVRAILILALVVLLITLMAEKEEQSAVTEVRLDQTSIEIMELLASQGLLEYTGVLEKNHLTTTAEVARQNDFIVPPGIKPFHWRMLIQEAKRLLGNYQTTNSKNVDKDSPPLPEKIVSDAPEDSSKLDMPKSRTLGHCHVTRSFIPPEKEDDPPLFWSFPGSGNTWIRFLLEQATGYYTGSVYRDLDIIKVMPGELRCDKSVVAVKGHPNWTPFDLVDGAYQDKSRFSVQSENGRDWKPATEYWFGKADIKPTGTIRGFHKKCADVVIKRALVVTRDPFAALWAEYQRAKSERIINGVKEYGHVAKLAKADFDPHDMRAQLVSLMQDWVLQFVGYEGFIERHGCDSVMFQSFEELVNPKIRDSALSRLAGHLKRPLVTTPECAFRLADHPAIKRDKVKDPAYMTIADAYNHPDVGNLVCDMYEIAAPELKVFGYEAPKLGPTKGVCRPPKRVTPVISRHAVLTSGSLNCVSDRVPGQSSAGYLLHADYYKNSSHPQPVKTSTILKPGVPQEEVLKEEVMGGMSPETTPYLTLACAGRNDNHSGNIVARTQNQLTNIAAYAERYKIFTEVIIVEWNPEPDRKPLSNVLIIPNTTSAEYITVRIMTVTKALHEIAVPPPIHLPVQQYVGKNVAVRRARGEFVLCWNADMLLNGAFFERVKRRDFKKGIYYRIDRIDFDKPFPDGFDVGNLEASKEASWIELHSYQVRLAVGTRNLYTAAEKATFWNDFHTKNDSTDIYAQRCCAQGCDRRYKSCRWVRWRGWSANRMRAEIPKLLAKGEIGEVQDMLNAPQHFHANAPGDFLMMSRDDWMRVRGYPEAPYQDEIDKYIMVEAFSAGMEQEIMMPPVASYHQYHSGSWGAAGELTADMASRPSLGTPKYIKDGVDMLTKGRPITLSDDPNELGCNNDKWGFGHIALHEMLVQPGIINTTRQSLRVVREPFDQLKDVRSPGCGWQYSAKKQA